MKRADLRPFRKFTEYQAEYAIARELPYWDFLGDLVVLADGTLVLGMKLQGVAIETFDADRVNKLALSFRSLLNSLPDGCEVSFVSEFDSECETLLDEHLQLKGSNELVGWVTDTRVASLREEVKTKNLLTPHLYAFVYRRYVSDESNQHLSLFAQPKRFLSARKEYHERAETELRQTTSALGQALESAGIECELLLEQEILDLVYRFLNPARNLSAPKLQEAHRSQEFLAEELARNSALTLPSPREQLAFSDLIQGYDSFYLDGLYHRCITLKTLPEFTHSALVSRLMQLPFPHLLHVHVKVPEQSKELAALQQKRRMAHSMSVSHGGKVSDLESQAKLHSTEELLQELINTGQKIFYFQCAVLIRAKTREEIDSETRTCLSRIRELNGAEGMAETVGAIKVWKTLLPLGNAATVRPKRVKTDNLADFLPLYQPYEGV